MSRGCRDQNYQGTEKNLADVFTKVLTSARRSFLIERFTFTVYHDPFAPANHSTTIIDITHCNTWGCRRDAGTAYLEQSMREVFDLIHRIVRRRIFIRPYSVGTFIPLDACAITYIYLFIFYFTKNILHRWIPTYKKRVN